jgi:tRNA1Val (adenine37-N6)-methyltransferase
VLTSEGRLLGGRLVYSQPASGFRSGIEPVLLAAATPAKPGELILEAGTGAGAALLCLNARVPGIHSVGVEADEAVARLAAANAEVNGFTAMEVIPGRIETVTVRQDFHHAIANPPYHPADGTPSPMQARDMAKRGSPTLLEAWVGWLAGHLRDRGTLTLIVTAGMVPNCLDVMAQSRCACHVIFPLWPMVGRAAKLVMIRGTKNSRMSMRLLSGLVLHQRDGAFTEAAQAVLSAAAAALVLG